jgi:phosphoribosylformimino-5-aminoimidazole carboxamide ribotide isomerase
MIVFPAIDLKAGQVVRLAEGDMDRATVYADDPAAQALLFASQGAEFLHVVDLDGAFAGRPENAEAVEEIIENFPGHIQLGGGIRNVVAVDARDGMVATEGWAEKSDMLVIDLARRFEDAGVASILFTDVGRDGMLTGCNIEATVDLARHVRIPVIASGGVKGIDDIHILSLHAKDGIEGVITGRAIYDGRLDLATAIAMANRA